MQLIQCPNCGKRFDSSNVYRGYDGKDYCSQSCVFLAKADKPSTKKPKRGEK